MTMPAYGIDGRAADRAEFYAVACDPRRSVVVEACAGAGKTWMLVSRVLRALLDGADPQHVLAITFTRKAAGEMRARLDEWLSDFAEGPGCSDAQRAQALVDRGVPPAQARELAPALGNLHERVLAGGRSVQVLTFHAWFAQLLSHAPLGLVRSLGLPTAYELLEDRDVLRGTLFARFHRRVQAVPALRGLYVGMVARHGRSLLLRWLDAAWTRASDVLRADAARVLDGSVEPAALLWPECAGQADPAVLLFEGSRRADLQAAAGQLASGGKPAQDMAAKLQSALDEADVDTAFALVRDALFTQKDEPRRALGEGELPRRVLAAFESVRAMRVQQRAHEDHRAMVHLARVLLAEYAALKHQRGLVDMDDLEFAAARLLADGEAAAWVQERLDLRVRHLLIDEFQDTSPSQWHALEPWLSSYAGAHGGASGQRPLSLFIVGDPKQSIYRFRGAEPRVFEAARRLVREGFAGVALHCDHTRRNAPAVIDALNAVFAGSAREGWGPFRPHTTESAAAGSVRALAGVPRPDRSGRAEARMHWRDSLTEPKREPEQVLRAAEARQVAQAIAALIDGEGFAPGEVMVLARRRAPLADVADALAGRGIAHALAEPLVLAEVPEVLDLVAVLDVLVSPGHDLSLARALKSPIFGATDDDLLRLADRSAAAGAEWLDVLCADAGTLGPALERAGGLMARWREVVHRLPPHDLLDRIAHEGEVLERMAAAVPPARRAFALQALRALLGAALGHGGGRFASAYEFLRELRAGRVRASRAAPADAVQLLTVHGAKGLEARAVVLVDCDPTPPANGGPQVLIDWPVQERAPRRVAFLRGSAALPASLVDTADAQIAEAAREETNGLYVAITRARDCLVFSHTEASRIAASPTWWQRVRAHATAWQPPDTDPASTPVGVVELDRLPVLNWQPAPADTPAGDPVAASMGRALHLVLQWAARRGAGWQRSACATAAAAAASWFGLPRASVGDLERQALAILESPQCARFFGGPGLRWADNEVTLADGGGLLRIDRLVALDEEGATTWWVLDYKLDHHPDRVAAYREQMSRYVAAVAAAQPGDRVRGAFVTAGGRVHET